MANGKAVRATCCAVALLLSQGCLTFLTYNEIPGQNVSNKAKLSQPEGYSFQESPRGSRMIIDITATETLRKVPAYLSLEADSAGIEIQSPVEKESAVRGLPFPAPVATVASPYVLTPSGIVAEVAGLNWACPRFADAAANHRLVLKLPPGLSAGVPSDISIAQNSERVTVRIQSQGKVSYFGADCPREDIQEHLGKLSEVASPLPESDQVGAWLQLSPKQFSLQDHFIVHVAERSTFVYRLPGIEKFKGAHILYVRERILRDARITDKGFALLMPFAIVADIITAPISIPALYFMIKGWERSH
ncbi:MAG: hypothetical protein JNM27_17265 [Leptospirales bacterium]|nr:hypothetical protein [Leptospirales bacterium]